MTAGRIPGKRRQIAGWTEPPYEPITAGQAATRIRKPRASIETLALIGVIHSWPLDVGIARGAIRPDAWPASEPWVLDWHEISQIDPIFFPDPREQEHTE